jgi:hypothetical protein
VAKRLLVTGVDLSARLTKGWEPLACVAQELLMRLLLDEMEVCIDSFGAGDLIDGEWRLALEDELFEDLDHEMLFNPALDGFETDPDSPVRDVIADMSFDKWFEPFDPERRMPPYAEA